MGLENVDTGTGHAVAGEKYGSIIFQPDLWHISYCIRQYNFTRIFSTTHSMTNGSLLGKECQTKLKLLLLSKQEG